MKDPETIRKEFTDLCTACGLCAAMCPPFAHRSIPHSNQEIQRQVRGFLDGDPSTEAVLERSRLCNECWKCMTETCPQGLNPMRTNQLLRGSLHEQGVDPRPFVPPSDPQSFERIAAALLTTEEELERITTPVVKGSGRNLFFAGCNIHYQPDLLLTSLDVIDLLLEDWTFLPGLELCCGSNHDSAGRLRDGSEALVSLTRTMLEKDYERIVVWCSTCAVRLKHWGFERPVITLAQLVADELKRQRPPAETLHSGVTLQEPCKDAYMGMDTQAPRTVLGLLSGEPVREMARHGLDTVCCGWALRQHRPAVWEEELRERVGEARAAGAKTMVTVCHGCQWIMDRPAGDDGVDVVNYIRLVGESLGISHPERFRALRKTESVDAALESIRGVMGDRYDQLPFEGERIRETVRILMGAFYGT